MENGKSKTQLFEFLTAIQAEVDAFVNGLSNEDKDRKGSLCQWSAKDVLSHLVFWGNHFNQQLINASEGKAVPITGDYGDQINDGVLFAHLDQPFAEAWKEYQDSFTKSKELLSALNADDLINGDLYEYTKGRSILDRALGTFGWHVTYHLGDYFVKAGFLENATTLQERYTEKLKQFSSWEANAIYNLACFYAQNGEIEKAILNLKPAFLIRPDLIEWSKKDSDLDPIREDENFMKLFAE